MFGRKSRTARLGCADASAPQRLAFLPAKLFRKPLRRKNMIDHDASYRMFEEATHTPLNRRHPRPAVRPSLTVAEPEQPVASTFDVVVSPFFRRKPTIDRLLAALLLIPGLPIIAMLILLMRLTSRGPGIFRQARVGKDGRVFTMLKIRTMRHDAEEGLGATWSVANDPRSTAVGKWIRKLHLDELPQLFNVLKGEMSLVGPRPERPEFVCVLEEALPGYRNRLLVRPGVTGLAQLCLPPDTDLCSACRKLAFDLEYVRSATLLTDVRLLVCTLIRIPKLPLRMALWFCGLSFEMSDHECSRCQVYQCNGHNGQKAMTAVALRSKFERSLSKTAGKKPAADRMSRTAQPVPKPR